MADVIVTATAIPTDGQCAHIVVTRLADFQSSEYRGLLIGATVKAPLGEDRVTATAYPPPCGTEPGVVPWTADPQTVNLVSGPNTVTLNFHQNVDVGIDPNFDDTKPLVVRGGSQVRISRNGEDTAGPNFALDGWEVKQLSLPPAPVGETVLFSLEGKGLPYTPLGLARTPDGNFIAQVSEVLEPLYVFTATGERADRWRVSYPVSMTQWNNTDAIEAIDATHFVRTGWLNRPIGCDADGLHCKQSGIEILEKKSGADGAFYVEVTKQIFLPELATEELNTEYPVGVAPVGSRFAVSVLSNNGGTSLVLLNADGTVAAGPTALPASNDIEGIFDDGAGRIIGLDYDGTLTTYNDTDLTPRAGETGYLGEGVGFGAPFRLTWRRAGGGSFIAYNSQRLVYATPDFSSISDVGIDLSGFSLLSGVEYRADTDELLVMDRFPGGLPTVVSFNLASKTQTGSVMLQPGLSVTVRPLGLAYMSSTNQYAVHYRRTSGADATLDAVVFIHNADGSLGGKFDLAKLGFTKITSVRYNAAADELVFLVVDATKATRILTTDRAFTPKRSYRTDALPDVVDLAPITSGGFIGDYGVVQSQPSYFARIALP
jgi:hypothetical protein